MSQARKNGSRTAQSVEQHDNAHDDNDSHHAANKTVESYLLLLHNACKINKKGAKWHKNTKKNACLAKNFMFLCLFAHIYA